MRHVVCGDEHAVLLEDSLHLNWKDMEEHAVSVFKASKNGGEKGAFILAMPDGKGSFNSFWTETYQDCVYRWAETCSRTYSTMSEALQALSAKSYDVYALVYSQKGDGYYCGNLSRRRFLSVDEALMCPPASDTTMHLLDFSTGLVVSFGDIPRPTVYGAGDVVVDKSTYLRYYITKKLTSVVQGQVPQYGYFLTPLDITGEFAGSMYVTDMSSFVKVGKATEESV